ncbi:MAG: NAD(P)H-hydrate dehydratase [Candidatus Micrarchaeota archaeon]|nr:NAD(P)H-hydrate dehydratase [Candidatus Micrarchaeota archaeon]
MYVTRSYLKTHLRKRLVTSHKGQNGRVLVAGGSRLYFGSPLLVAVSAFRTGADLVYLLTPEYISKFIAPHYPDLIIWGYGGEYLNETALPLFDELHSKTDAMVIGNGLTKQPGVLKTASELIRRWDKPLVIDADCVQPNLKTNSKQLLYTPHMAEFSRLTGARTPENLKERIMLIEKTAKELSATLLLKGRPDIISDGDRLMFNNIHNPGMTVGGTGDTLAGIACALLSQKYSAFEAACMAAYINGVAGNLAKKKYGYSFIASDLMNEIPNVLKQFQ